MLTMKTTDPLLARFMLLTYPFVLSCYEIYFLYLNKFDGAQICFSITRTLNLSNKYCIVEYTSKENDIVLLNCFEHEDTVHLAMFSKRRHSTPH
jgi:hypothetical protein